jgi:hypothetical protein
MLPTASGRLAGIVDIVISAGLGPGITDQLTDALLSAETAAFAEKLSALCVSEPTFRNLDVVRVLEL